MSKYVIYRFFASRNERTMVEMHFDEQTFRILPCEDEVKPDWTKLSFQRCPNCTLPDGPDAYCPAAAALADFLPRFATRISYEKAVVEVETPSRTIVSKTTFQHGIASLIGLAMATSGCPHTRFLRPMARNHLPFASEEETVLRSLAFHLLAQYVSGIGNGGGALAVSLERLKDNYAALSIVNNAMAERIRSVISRDAAVNAVIILESFALITPDNIDNDYSDIRSFFVVEDEAAA